MGKGFRELAGKRYGKAMFVPYTEKSLHEVCPTGSLPLDVALGIGGLPFGLITQYYGNPGSGKSTLVNHTIAQVQRLGYNALLVDTEYAFDVQWAKRIGVIVDDEKLVVVQPDSAEQAYDIMEMGVASGEFGLVALDSVGAMLATRELEETDPEKTHVAGIAKPTTRGMKRVAAALRRAHCVVLVTNQQRDVIGGMGYETKQRPGGWFLKHSTSIEVEVKRGKKYYQGTERHVYGNEVILEVKKNKCAPPFKRAVVGLIYDAGGYDETYSLVEYAISFDLIKQAGAWFEMAFLEEPVKLQGKSALYDALRTDPATRYALENDIRARLRLPCVNVEADSLT
jgi:recombination protein RecA